ncbi:MAG: aldehyde:ferredoxin oxidoreductase, partial [Synergistetes bacterium]|nr:aldehyde:ferredoxin oxidoreductase [Synergistota bacterium]
VICFFARGIYSPEITTSALRITGLELSEGKLKEIGKAIHIEKYRFKHQEGFSLKDIRIPERIFQTPSAVGMIEKAYITEALDYINSDILSAF